MLHAPRSSTLGSRPSLGRSHGSDQRNRHHGPCVGCRPCPTFHFEGAPERAWGDVPSQAQSYAGGQLWYLIRREKTMIASAEARIDTDDEEVGMCRCARCAAEICVMNGVFGCHQCGVVLCEDCTRDLPRDGEAMCAPCRRHEGRLAEAESPPMHSRAGV